MNMPWLKHLMKHIGMIWNGSPLHSSLLTPHASAGANSAEDSFGAFRSKDGAVEDVIAPPLDRSLSKTRKPPVRFGSFRFCETGMSAVRFVK